MLGKKKKKNTFVPEILKRYSDASPRHLFFLWMYRWRDARVVEEARLESVYTPKVYRGFESRSLRCY